MMRAIARFALASALCCPPSMAGDSSVSASLVVKVPIPEVAADSLVARAEEAGGYFSARGTDQVTVRIPTAKVDPFLAEASQLGTVVDRQLSRQDHTLQLSEIASRLAAREQMLDQYYKILAEADPKAVVTVEREIVNLVAQVEQYKGQLRVLQSQVDLATVSVSFQFRDRTAPVADGSSSFAWLNSLNLSSLLDEFQYRKGWTRLRWTAVPAAPDGFAPYRKGRSLRAVSPDDVVFRVRSERQKPRATLAFWKEATRKRMEDAGYKVQGEGDIEAGGAPGGWLDLTAPVGTQDDSYLVVFFPVGRRIVIVEAAGEVSKFQARKEAILAAVRGMPSGRPER